MLVFQQLHRRIGFKEEEEDKRRACRYCVYFDITNKRKHILFICGISHVTSHIMLTSYWNKICRNC